jgi:hypothetical protein
MTVATLVCPACTATNPKYPATNTGVASPATSRVASTGVTSRTASRIPALKR